MLLLDEATWPPAALKGSVGVLIHSYPFAAPRKREGKKQRERERGEKEREGREREGGSREEEGHRWSKAPGGGRGVGPSGRRRCLVESRRGRQEQSREKKEEEGWRERERGSAEQRMGRREQGSATAFGGGLSSSVLRW